MVFFLHSLKCLISKTWCLGGHCAQNSDLPRGAMGSAREKNEFSLAFLQPGGNAKALSEPKICRTWSCSYHRSTLCNLQETAEWKGSTGDWPKAFFAYKAGKKLWKKRRQLCLTRCLLWMSCAWSLSVALAERENNHLVVFQNLTFPNHRNVSCRRKQGYFKQVLLWTVVL